MTRACIELEANFKSILRKNGYPKKEMSRSDYKLLEKSHRLSEYEVRLPHWLGEKNSFVPFLGWNDGNDGKILWYDAYNNTKHDRVKLFKAATFEAMLNSICALAVILAAQFGNEDFGPSGYTTKSDGEYRRTIGKYFQIKYPVWPVSERYNLDRSVLDNREIDPFQKFDYMSLAQTK